MGIIQVLSMVVDIINVERFPVLKPENNSPIREL